MTPPLILRRLKTSIKLTVTRIGQQKGQTDRSGKIIFTASVTFQLTQNILEYSEEPIALSLNSVDFMLAKKQSETIKLATCEVKSFIDTLCRTCCFSKIVRPIRKTITTQRSSRPMYNTKGFEKYILYLCLQFTVVNKIINSPEPVHDF